VAQDSKGIAGIVGPLVVAMLLSENQFVNPHLYDLQIPPVVYLSGALFFLAGLLIVRAHNLWSIKWPVLITVLGWLALLLGLFRMFFPNLYARGAQENAPALLVFEALGLGVGLFLTFKGYQKKA
jgi:hypothetical protein